MRSVSVAKRIIAIPVHILGLLLASKVAWAASSQVQVAVCSAGSVGSTVTIATPQSDSIVNQPGITVAGSVSNATQIDVSIDGMYSSTVPLSASDTSYTTTLQLSAGTHTISLVANDVCQVQDGTASVVVTYQPQSTPSTGAGTPTQVNTGGGVVVGPISSEASPSEVTTTLDAFQATGLELLRALDFDATAKDSLILGIARFMLMTTGLGLLLFGAGVWFWKWRQDSLDQQVGEYILTGNQATAGVPQPRFAPWVIRASGAVMVVIALLI